MTADEVRALRQRIGLTQEAFGKLIGVRGNTVARWERGEAHMQPANDKLVRLTIAHYMLPAITPKKVKKARKEKVRRPTRKVK